MKVFITLIALFLGSHLSYAQRHISKSQAIEDVNYFVDNAEQIHPNLYFKISKSDFKQHLNSFTNQIKDSISVNDFSKHLRAVANLLGDGHTNVRFSNDLRDTYINSKSRLPFKIKIRNESIFIDVSYDDKLKPNDEILALNKNNTKVLLQLIKYPSADIESLKTKKLEKYFSYYFFVEYGYTNKVELKIKRDGVKYIKSVDLIQKSIKEKKEKYAYKILNDSTAILQLNSFSGLNKKNYKTFLEETFNDLSTKPIHHLIIDVSKNGGGNSNYGHMVYPYLNITSVRYHQLYQIKTSKPEKKSIRKRFVKWYLYPLYPFGVFSKMGRILLYKKNGTITDIKTDASDVKPTKNAFKGKVSVLTSSNSYSAAADFVVGFKYAKRGNVVGDTLGQPYSGYIDIIFLELPNSKITAGVSFKKYEYVGTTNSNRLKGIEPNIYIDIDSYEQVDDVYKVVNGIKQ